MYSALSYRPVECYTMLEPLFLLDPCLLPEFIECCTLDDCNQILHVVPPGLSINKIARCIRSNDLAKKSIVSYSVIISRNNITDIIILIVDTNDGGNQE